MLVRAFNVRKAAQVVAFFANAGGGSINVLKLVKLVYLADRESMALYDSPILFDQMVSMDHGPVNSATLDLINGMATDVPGWSEFVGPRKDHEVSARQPVSATDLDELSARDLRVLSAVWTRFGGMGKYVIRDYTHHHCPEWENSSGSSAPIPYDRIFKYLGKEDAQRLADQVWEHQQLSELLEKNAVATADGLEAE